MTVGTRRRAAIVVLDGVGVGAAPDAASYGDVGSDTLAHVCEAAGGLSLPNFERWGLGCLAALCGVPPVASPAAAWGRMRPASAGKDSTTGHWEIAGVRLERPFPTYPDGFPTSLLHGFAEATGRGVIGNVVGSGTAVVDAFGPEHERTGAWIVYTSADSVFQIAAHEAVIPLAELYAACTIARAMLVAPDDVSRVIARPFVGAAGAYRRTGNRRDYSVAPPAETLLDALADADVPRHGVGKVDDLFAGRAITACHTTGNADGLARVEEWLAGAGEGLLFANLVDFDALYGHRNDPAGFAAALRTVDAAVPALEVALRKDDLLFITADHGNDPTTPSTDHAREYVPLLARGIRVSAAPVGERGTFADLGATVAEWFDVAFVGTGTSFLPRLLDGASA
ncbi:phosphopentomutase [Gemmatimonadetes bacterium T265]|nr:phosphopentomutase [Gemmatimonadetes bacterium T265]